MSTPSGGLPTRPSVLAGLHGPGDLKALPADSLAVLADECRQFLVSAVSQTGGHLGPNLGVVELTIALHRVFDSPRDAIVFDTGHQSYVHKLLTGRQDFSHLRGRGGLSGYPSRAESIHDIVENTHASAGLSWAAGIAAARRLETHGQPDGRYTIAVVGDGALTGGMSWEALNNIAEWKDVPLIIVVNDNGRSYEPTIGGLATHLAGLRTTGTYERVLNWGRRFLTSHGRAGALVYSALHGLKKGIKDVVAPQVLFEDLGLKYIGAIDGHNIGQLIRALERAKAFGGPVIVHAITEKGRGYAPAEGNQADRFHAVGRIHPETGLPVTPSRSWWTSVFAEELVAAARANERIVALTAAMREPVGLAPFAAEFPDRVMDVGIAEQHAVTAAAGMAFEGLHPVVAVYATFLNRAFDQILMDAGLHSAPLTLVLDRAGLTGDDGPSHNGQWDLAMLRMVPGMRVAAPRDAPTLRAELAEALADDDGPTAVRYPKGDVPDDIVAIDRMGGLDILARTEGGAARVLVVSVGACAPTALNAARTLAHTGIGATVVDPRWVLPVHGDVVRLAAGHDAVVTIEDGLVSGGVGEAVAAALQANRVTMPVLTFGIPSAFLAQARRDDLLAEAGVDAAGIAASVAAALMPNPAGGATGALPATPAAP
ncbi:MAG: 1-deoxy-D-xylulose-5-phosphate synthase [Bifidobacteriaceae bacterium]|nr:1-deoxy-D-xylulose-5-phosphate synthase [Bifidobacteriaceae bacterium]